MPTPIRRTWPNIWLINPSYEIETKSIHTIPTTLNFLLYLQVDIYPEDFWGPTSISYLVHIEMCCSNLEMIIAETKLECCKQN